VPTGHRLKRGGGVEKEKFVASNPEARVEVETLKTYPRPNELTKKPPRLRRVICPEKWKNDPAKSPFLGGGGGVGDRTSWTKKNIRDLQR